tara:strand:- start:542 stop:655 length:114 start_codon:yes stop_codon:yes gene_type:complete
MWKNLTSANKFLKSGGEVSVATEGNNSVPTKDVLEVE